VNGPDRPDRAARRLAEAALQAARDAARERSLDPLRDAVAPGPQVADRRLARRLARDAEQARRAQLLAQQQHEAAVARRDRVLRRSRRAIPPWGVVGAGAVGAAAAAPAVVAPTPVLLAVGAAATTRVAVALVRLRRPPAVPPPPPALPAGPPPPHPRSAAFPAVRRLEQVRGALGSLLPLVGPAGREVAEEAWAAAAENDTALRWQAARLAAAEPHRGVDAAELARLEAGVLAQEGLVQAVADLVAASADPAAGGRLEDVTDRLHGLAQGLREVR
jgi:hypothetical protein